MIRNNSLAYIILVITMSIPLVLYIKNYSKIVNNSKLQSRSQIPLLKLIFSGLFVIIGCMGFIFRFPWYLDFLKYIAIQYSVLLSYSANVWILNQRHHALIKDPIFWATNAFQLISLIAGFYSRNNLGLIIAEETFSKTPLYYIHYFFALLSYTLIIPFTLVYTYKSIVQSKNMVYKIRRSIVFINFFSCLFGSLLIILSLLLSIYFDTKYVHIINIIYLPTIPLYGIIPFANMIPEPLINRFIKPFTVLQKQRTENNHIIITHLHAIITTIVPNVRLHNITPGHQRKLIEIGDARDLILSQYSIDSRLSSSAEAVLLLDLFQQGIQIRTAGPHHVPPVDNIYQHFIAVGTHLIPAPTKFEHQVKEIANDPESSQRPGV